MQRSASTALVHQVRRTIRRYAMLVPGDRVLVAVSGGPDSTALLAAFVALAPSLDIDVCAAHFNHHLRGEESQRDQHCAQSVAETLGVRCIVGETTALSGRSNLEARAREQRYGFLLRMAGAEGCTKIATGHTLDDQAETVVMRLLRGSGWDGLACIQPVREGSIVRPMIECSRQQVVAFLHARGLPSCEDSSNQDRRLLRNRVRHDVMPLLRSINPNVAGTLASTAEILAAEGAVLDEQVLAALPTSTALLPVGAIRGTPPALRGRAVRAWLRAQRGDLRGLAAAHVRSIVDLALSARPGGHVRLPGGQRVARQYDHLHWEKVQVRPANDAPRELRPGTAVSFASGWRISAQLEARPDPQRPQSLWELAADAAVVPAPLIVRSARPGDRVQPLGMCGHRKLQDIFVDRKLPRDDRWALPVIEAAGEILWVPGVVRSGAALITAETRSTLHLAARKTGIAGG